jgi:hypothetical protein
MIVSGMTGNTGNKNLRGLPLGAADNSTFVFIEGATTSSRAGTWPRLMGENNTLRTNADNACFIQINNYTSTTAYKPFIFYSRFINASSTQIAAFGSGCIQNNAAITSFAFDYEGTNTFASGTVLLYGVK